MIIRYLKEKKRQLIVNSIKYFIMISKLLVLFRSFETNLYIV